MENVSASLDKIGDLLLPANDLTGAFQAFEEELEFDRKLYARDPDRVPQQNLVRLNRVADQLRRENDRAGAAKIYEESLAIDRRLSAGNLDDAAVQENYQSHAERLADLLLRIGNVAGAKKAYDDRFSGLARLIDIRRKSYLGGGRTKPAETALAGARGDATRVGLLSNHPREVVGYADEALKLDPGKRAIEANRATALLLSGRAAEAKAVYEALKKVPHPRDATLTWIAYVKDDLALLRRLGITNPDLEQVARELGI
jgi:tetratricopeptide (TPR) repeat protein